MADNINNLFKVYGYGGDLESSNVYETGSLDYDSLFSKAIEPNTTAKSQDVLTPLRELTTFSVAFFNWLVDPAQGLSGIQDFKGAIVDPDKVQTEQNLQATLTNIKNGLTQGITNRIDAKEDRIRRPSSQGGDPLFLKAVYNNNILNWSWDDKRYETHTTGLTDISTFFSAGSNEGFVYKASDSANAKHTNLPFIYFDSESTDPTSGNLILNLKTFTYPKN